MRKLLCVLISFFLFSMAFEAAAQMKRSNIKKNNKRMSRYQGKKFDFKDKAYSMMGVSLNALNYYGDLAPRPSRFSTDISFTRPALGLSFAHRFGPRYTLTGTFMYGALGGSDTESADKGDENGRFRYQRNLSFRNRIKELAVVASVDLWKNEATYISRVKWTPYAFAGVAVFHHNPQGLAPQFQLDGVTPLAEAGQWVNLQKLGTEGQFAALDAGDSNHGIKSYKLIQPAIPFGLGARFRLNEVVDLSVELGFRYLFTDYLDDVSQNYVDLGVFGDNELAKAMSYRSNEVIAPNLTYTGRDNQQYSVLSGYGHERFDSMRGNKRDNDTYMVTTFKLTYIIGKTFHRAKFR